MSEIWKTFQYFSVILFYTNKMVNSFIKKILSDTSIAMNYSFPLLFEQTTVVSTEKNFNLMIV